MSCACPAGLGDTVSLDDFLPYIQPQAPNAPAEMAAHYVRLAAIQFCRQTQILKERVCVDVQEGVHDYCLELEDCDLNTVSLANVCVGGRPYTATRTMPCDAGQGLAATYFYQHPHDLLIWPAPSCDEKAALCADVVVAPGQDACDLPRRLYDDFAEVLGDGGASKLLLVKGADWYDPQAAGIYLKRFMNGVRAAKALASRGSVNQPIYMRARRWV